MIRLVVVDLDGTLLDEKGEVDRPRLSNILDQLDQRGIDFVVATGNDFFRTRLLLGNLVDRMDLILVNGAKFYQKGQLRKTHFWSPDLVAKALNYFSGQETVVHLVVVTSEGSFVQKGTSFPLVEKVMTKERAQDFYRQLHYVSSLKQTKLPPVLKMGLSVPEKSAKERTEQINQDFLKELRAVTSGHGGIDLLEFGIHKAWGLGQLLEEKEIAPEQVMAFGDSENDLEMLRLSGESYAMANGEARLKVVAKHRAPRNSEAGVYRVLEDFLQKE